MSKTTTMKTGTVKFFKKDKGYGFIIDDESQTEVFVHITNCKGDINSDDRVTFDITQGKKGDQATNVSRI
jgi:CspA family cold shock protein